MAVDSTCEVSVNGGLYTDPSGGIDVAPGDLVDVRLVDSTGVTTWYFVCHGTDELSTAPSLANVNFLNNQVNNPTDVVSFVYPAFDSRALGFKSIAVGITTDVSSFGVYTLVPANSLRVGFVGEKREGSGAFGWSTKLNPLIRGAGFSPGGDIGGNSASQEVVGWRNHPLAVTNPSSGNVMLYDGATWNPEKLTLDPEVIGPAYSVSLSGGGLREVNSYMGTTTFVTDPVFNNTLVNVVTSAGFFIGQAIVFVNGATVTTTVINNIIDNVDGASFFVDDPQTLSIGAGVTVSQAMSINANYPPTALQVTNNRSAEVISPPLVQNTSFETETYYQGVSYNDSIQFTLTANKGAIVRSSSTTFTWVQKVFYGIGSAGGNTEAFIEGLATSVLATGRGRTFTVTAGAGQKIYYAHRAAYGTATFFVGGFEGGFGSPTTISVTNQYGFTENYFLYESENANLGTTTIQVT